MALVVFGGIQITELGKLLYFFYLVREFFFLFKRIFLLVLFIYLFLSLFGLVYPEELLNFLSSYTFYSNLNTFYV